MLEAPQVVNLDYNGYKYTFSVWRYNSDVELHAALNNAGIKYDKNTIAHTECKLECGEQGGQCGNIYLLDKSIEILAQQAALMASYIYGTTGPWQLVYSGKQTNGITEVATLTGRITSELYSKNKFF